MFLKLLMDFYGDDMVARARSVLLENVTVPDDDEAKRSRKGLNKKLNSMKDILNVFLVLTLDQLPLFVAEDLANLPPLSMDNFDMSSVIKDMDSIKNQRRLLQEAQETSLSVHAALCNEKSREGAAQPIENEAVRSPAPSTGATPERSTPHTPTGSPPHRSPITETPRTPMQHRRIDDGEGNDDDLLHLAQIQGRLSLSPNPGRSNVRDNARGDRHQSPSNYNRNSDGRNDRYNILNAHHRKTNQGDYDVSRGDGNANSLMRHTSRDHNRNNFNNRSPRHQPPVITGANSSYASAVSRPRANPQHSTNPQDRANPQHRANNRNIRSARSTTSVITGTNNSCELSAARPRTNPHTRKDGLFISRSAGNTRAIDVVNYIRSEANLNLRCDPLPTRYDSYRSYYIHAHPRHHDLLLRPGMWPKNVILRQYQTDD